MATSADVISFRLSYNEFRSMSDPDIASALDDADVWIDRDMWAPGDYPTARYLWAAHNLNIYMILLAQQEALGEKMGFTDQALTMISFGERRVAFRQLRGLEQKKSTYATGPDILLAETTYGQLFLKLRSRNIMPILTV